MLQKWDKTIPLDTEMMGKGATEIRVLKEDLQDHLTLNHQMNDVLDPLQGDCSGYHKMITLFPLASDPAVPVDAGIVYCKVVDGVQELFWIDKAGGIINQLTENGVLKLNTLQNDLDGNGKVIQNVNMDYFIKRQRKVLTPFPAKPQFMFREIERTSNGISADVSYWELEVKQACVVMISVGTRHSATQSANSILGPLEIGEIKEGNGFVFGVNAYSAGVVFNDGEYRLSNQYGVEASDTASIVGEIWIDETFNSFRMNPLLPNLHTLFKYLEGGIYYLKTTISANRNTGTARAAVRGRVLYGYDPTANINDIIVATQKGVGWS
jgi:hypothetical protein